MARSGDLATTEWPRPPCWASGERVTRADPACSRPGGPPGVFFFRIGGPCHFDLQSEPGERRRADGQGPEFEVFLEQRVVKPVQHHWHGHNLKHGHAVVQPVEIALDTLLSAPGGDADGGRPD